MDQKIRNRVFITVSKNVVEIYIDLVQKQGYKVIKAYSGWKLPHVSDNNFKIRSLKHMLDILTES